MPWAIGLFVMDWASYERFLIRLVSDIEKVEIATLKPQLLKGGTKVFAERLRRCRNNSDDPILVKLLDELIPKHEILVDVRHNIVHGYWQGMDENHSFVHKRYSSRVSRENVSLKTSTDVLKNRDDINVLNGKIFDILVHLGTMKRSD